MSKVTIWSKDQAKKELKRRLDYARKHREQISVDWADNERAVFGTTALSSRGIGPQDLSMDLSLNMLDEDDGITNSGADSTTSYIFKNLRFIHSQLSSNPPVVMPRPTGTQQDKRRKAETADKAIRYGLRQYNIPDNVDLAEWYMLIYGTGFSVIEHDSELGDVIRVEKDGTLVMEGDISLRNPSPWNMYLDPDATEPRKVRWYFERFLIPEEEAQARWSDKWEILKQRLDKTGDTHNSESSFHDYKERVIEVFEYWETGLPINGYLGRYGVCLADGEIIEDVCHSPHAFTQPIEGNEEFKIARLPIKILTDVDVPGRVWGMSSVRWASPLQKNMNRIDSIELENAQAHGVTRLVLPENVDMKEGSITNSPWDVVKLTGNAEPHFIQPPTMMPQMDGMREKSKQGVDDMMGVNETMFGQQSREMAGFAMQYATNQGNMIRYRLFKKLTMFVEGIYRDYLDLIKEHWTTGRMIKVVGKGKALEALELKGTDIDGGYDLVVEYGTSFSLDPTIRKQEIMQMIPLYKEAGVPVKSLIKRLQLADTEGIQDLASLAEDRQREIFEQIISDGQQVQPRKYDDHVNMLAYASIFVMTEEYKYLEDELKDKIDEHIQLRAQAASSSQQPGQPAPAGGGQPPSAPAGQPPAASVNQSGLAGTAPPSPLAG